VCVCTCVRVWCLKEKYRPTAVGRDALGLLSAWQGLDQLPQSAGRHEGAGLGLGIAASHPVAVGKAGSEEDVDLRHEVRAMILFPAGCS
jgi:hypothetical protein